MIGDEHTFKASPGTPEYNTYREAWDFGLRIHWEDENGVRHWGKVWSMDGEIGSEVRRFRVQEVGENE
jgi:hypothetical protein